MSEPLAAGAEAQLAERARALLSEPPWDDRAQVLTLLGVRPPEGIASVADQPGRLWLILDAADVRDLEEQWLEPLLRHRLRRVSNAALDLTVVTSEGMFALLDAVTRRALEARWEIRHSYPLHDARGRFEALSAAAARLPEGALERLVRPLYLQVYRALEAWPDAPTASPIPLGEAASGIARLACILEEGAHPTAEWLVAGARETSLGRRIAPWLDGFAPGIASEVFDEVATALRVSFADREWLRDPESYALRPPSERR